MSADLADLDALSLARRVRSGEIDPLAAPACRSGCKSSRRASIRTSHRPQATRVASSERDSGGREVAPLSARQIVPRGVGARSRARGSRLATG
jgi:hypothetical protein